MNVLISVVYTLTNTLCALRGTRAARPLHTRAAQTGSNISSTHPNTHATSIRHWTRGLLLLPLFCIPQLAHAALTINEIAWMGTTVSANDEWIELYNAGSEAVSVDGWILTDGLSLEIILAGSIASGQYAVLERTDDDSAPGTAFLVYTGALPNTGTTLSLHTADGTLHDRVAGGEDWAQIGGDNATKETAQYSHVGWVTAVATPGTATVASATTPDPDTEAVADDEVVFVEDQEKTTQSSGASSKSSATPDTVLYVIPRTLTAAINAPARVYVNQEILLEARSAGLATPILNSLAHVWNFGDFNTGTGTATTHRYAYPGEYVIQLQSTYKDYSATARKTVMVLPVNFSLTTNSKGDIQVHNDAKYEVDLSGYRITAGVTRHFPDGTFLLPGGTITIPKNKLAYVPGTQVRLADDTSIELALLTHPYVPHVPASIPAVAAASPARTHAASVPDAPAPQTAQDTAMAQTAFGFASEEEEVLGAGALTIVQPEPPIPPGLRPLQAAAAIEAAQTIPTPLLPYLALLAVIILAVLTVVLSSGAKQATPPSSTE